MKKLVTIISALLFLALMTLPALGQNIADGYAEVLGLNTFDGAPYPSIPADEVHAGYDLDKDGNLEFIFLADHSHPNGPGPGTSDGHSVYVYEWNESAFTLMWSWADTSLRTGGASFPTMAVADLDGDTNQEIVLGMPSGSGWPSAEESPTVIYVFEFGMSGGPAEPTATWTANTGPGSNSRPAGMAAGDIDGDGNDEVAVAFRAFSDAASNDAMVIFSVPGGFAGEFTVFQEEVYDTTSDVGSVYSVDITDIDNDGNLEAYFSTDNHHIFEALGPDDYELTFVANPTVAPWTIQGAGDYDIDGDGNNELVWGHWSTGSFRMLHSVTDLALIDSTNEAHIATVEPAGCRGLTVGDFDGDGNGDIFLGGNYAGSVWRIEYSGSGAITDSASYTYEKVYQDSVPGGDPRVYDITFAGDGTSLDQNGGNSLTDLNGNGMPEFLIAYEDGDSLQNWIVMVESDQVLSIEVNPGSQVLNTYTLRQNYPNPFNPSTTISYQLPVREHVSLKIYDSLGKEIKTLVNGVQNAGENISNWDGTNNAGDKVVSGFYIYKLKAGKTQLSKRMVLVK